jgi:hypothetical protein
MRIFLQAGVAQFGSDAGLFVAPEGNVIYMKRPGVEVFRLEAARRLLEETEQGVDRIARSCGFGDEERMRTTFQRHLAISPRDYRRRFSTRSITATESACNEL